MIQIMTDGFRYKNLFMERNVFGIHELVKGFSIMLIKIIMGRWHFMNIAMVGFKWCINNQIDAKCFLNMNPPRGSKL